MKLLYQTHSPYARKALVFAHETGIAEHIEVVHQETSPTLRNEQVFAANPLGKVPVLLRPALPPLFDSDVICAYLDTQHEGRKLIPPEGEARWQALRVQSVAQGLADAGIAVRWETVRRPEALRYPPLRDGYIEKLTASYDWAERELDVDAPMHIGHIALATAICRASAKTARSSRPGSRSSRPGRPCWQHPCQGRRTISGRYGCLSVKREYPT
jgi:glutathione S-transferase